MFAKQIIHSTLALLTLSACQSTNRLTRPTMQADPARIGYEAQAAINKMRLAFEETPSDECGTVIKPSLQNLETESYRSAGSFNCVRFKSIATPAAQDAITPLEYAQAGVMLSNLYCDDYFDRIAKRRQIRQFGRSTTNDVGTAASAALGLASASSGLTGGIGVMFGLLDNFYRNYDTAFTVEADLGKIRRLVKERQKELWDSKPAFASFEEANGFVGDYSSHCSYVGMQTLLNRAIDAGTPQVALEDRVTSAQTAASRLKAAEAEEKAKNEERILEAARREKAAKDAFNALQKEGTPPVTPDSGQ